MGEAEMNYRRRRITPHRGTRQRFELRIARSRSAQEIDRGRTKRAGNFPLGYFRQAMRSRQRLRGAIRHAGPEKRTATVGVVQMTVAVHMQQFVAEEQQHDQKRKMPTAAIFCQCASHAFNISWRCRPVNQVSPSAPAVKGDAEERRQDDQPDGG